ncbi:MAG TPA: hypothetical protein DEA70_00950 [Acidimicrobiaceae bacterium]|nr:hypothetical protein [Acidimicrobiaceae bacterium]
MRLSNLHRQQSGSDFCDPCAHWRSVIVSKDVVVVTFTGGAVVVSGIVVVDDSIVVDGVSVVVGNAVVEEASSAVSAPSALLSSELLQAAKHRTATALTGTSNARFDRCVG